MSIFNTAVATPHLSPARIKNDFFSFAEEETKYNLTEDILVMSCTLRRLHQEIQENPSAKIPSDVSSWSLTGNADDIVKHITPEDREKAITVRNHFLRKLTQFAIIVGPLTSFKSNMNDLLNINFLENRDTYVVPDSLVGIAYRLPEFYEYDLEQMTMFEDKRKTVIGSDKSDVAGLPVKFLKKLVTGRKKDKTYIEYWFEDELNNRILTKITKGNPLIPLLDKAVESRNLKLTASLIKRENYTVEYYVASRWSLAE